MKITTTSTRHFGLAGVATLCWLVALPGPARADVVIYNDPGMFEAATSDDTAYAFPVSPAPVDTYVGPSFTAGPLTFVATPLFLTNDGTFGSGVTYLLAPGGVETVTLSGATALSFALGTFGAGQPIAISVNGAAAATVTDTDGHPNTVFVGFTDTVPITSLTFTNTAQPGGEIDVINFQVGSVPEPSTWAVVLASAGLLGVALRRRPAMIQSAFTGTSSMKMHPFLFAVAALAALACFPMASRVSADLAFPNIVTPNDTFNICVAGFNTTDGSGIYLVNPITATFNGLGTAGAQTFSGDALGSQNVTVTTTQTISGFNITDSISLSVPTNFIPSGTTTGSGAVINEIELDMGAYNAGTNTLDFTPAITGTPSYTYSTQYDTSFTVGLAAHATLTNGNTSLYYYQANSTTSPAGLSQYDPTAFNFSMTYVVPEPSTYALCAFGVAGFMGVAARRRRARA